MQKLSSFQEHLALLMAGAALFGLGVRKELPPWAGVMLMGVSGLALGTGAGLFLSKATESEWDTVAEASEESFPASDAPAWSMGGR